MISVIIPTYNRADMLMSRALPSAMEQTHEDWEILIIGDGTDQATVHAVNEIGDPRVRFWNLAHDIYPDDFSQAWGLHGLTALNFGLDWARGEWISVLNDDDAFTLDHHEVLLAEAEKSGADFVYGMSDTYKNGYATGQMYGAFPPGDGSVTQGSYLYRRSLEYRYRRDCHTRGRNGDADMWIRMRDAGVSFSFLPRVVHHYHRNWP
jgi:O-antigen biosynthesis protein